MVHSATTPCSLLPLMLSRHHRLLEEARSGLSPVISKTREDTQAQVRGGRLPLYLIRHVFRCIYDLVLTSFISSGIRVSAAVPAIPCNPILVFILFVFTSSLPARLSSSIRCMPEPSTSQSPPWAMFHNPCLPLSMKPKENDKGR